MDIAIRLVLTFSYEYLPIQFISRKLIMIKAID